MSAITRRLARLEAHDTPPPRPVRWVVCATPEEVAAAEADATPGELLIIWRLVDPKKEART